MLGLALLSLPVAAASLDPALLERAQLGPVPVLIELQERADLSGASQLTDKIARGQWVMQQLRSTAVASQAPLLALLDARGLSYRSFWVANAVELRADAADLLAIAALPRVAAVHPVLEAQFAPVLPAAKADVPLRMIEPGLELVGATRVWDLGVLGEGVVVGDHDIGVEWDHPALKRQYRGYAGDTVDHAYNWRNAFGSLDPFCPDPEVPCDSHGHGTHTTGTMVGDDGAGHRIGMAPKAQWIACRSLYDPIAGLGTLPTYLDCMEWFIAPYPEGQPDLADPARAPDVINNSWGCVEACPPSILQDVDEATKAAGIVQVGSAGNDGRAGCSTIAFPLAIYESTFTVGSSTMDDSMSSFSSMGPVLSDLSMRLKPNVVAPGSGVVSADLGGSYSSKSGTSMASPHVSGLVALMISANPALRGQVDEIRSLIEQTAVPIESSENCGGTGAADIPNNIFGHGRIDAFAAVTAAAPELLEPADGGAPRGAAVSAGGAASWLLILALSLLGRRVATRRRPPC